MRNQPIAAAISAYRAEALRVARWERARRLTAACSLIGVLILFKTPILVILTVAVILAFLYWRFSRKTKRPGLTSAARRLESFCPDLTGILAGAVELEREESPVGSPELRRLTAELALDALETRVAAISASERASAILGRSVDAAFLERRRRVELGWTFMSACLAAFFLATLALRLSAKDGEPTVPDAAPIRVATPESDVPSERVREPESTTYSSVAASLGALCATLERLETLARELSAEEDGQSASKLAREIEYYVESESDGAVARTKQTLDLTRDAAAIRGFVDERISGRDGAAFLLARRLVALSSYWETCKALKKELLETIGTRLRNDDATRRTAARRDVARLADAFAGRVGDELRVLGILASSWEFGARLDALDESRRALLREAVENLAARPGVSEWDEEADPRARASFLERLDDLRERLSEFDALLRDDVAVLQQEENADFVSWARETATKADVYDLFFRSTSVDSATKSVEARRAALERAASSANAELWGLAARALDESGGDWGASNSNEDVEASAALAAFLAWGACPDGELDDVAELTQAPEVAPRDLSGEATGGESGEEVASDGDVASDSGAAPDSVASAS
ncbi:MAG: hypothetical protein IK077_05555, partial [Thermoguttaceae bacterium]|nr:hypothetical protein [Thermoguttaceae bacterium]